MDKIITILGTRPEIIRLSRIIPKLDKNFKHILVHTGQNYDNRLSDVFFEDLKLRKPDYYLKAKGSMATQIASILERIEPILKKESPNKVLVLGDTNSGLGGIIAERMGIPVYHMEAGNRCHDKEVPEEINRRIIDHIATYNFPYTPNSKKNLCKEGIDRTKLLISGNPIYEVLKYYESKINSSNILKKLKLKKDNYFLTTFHRAECVDKEMKLKEIIKGLELITKDFKLPIICSIHPRTKNKIRKYNLKYKKKYIKFLNPVRFFDFVKLEKNALCMITDSGTCCEEGTILRTPTVICRDSTERPETVKVGSAIVSGIDSDNILSCVKTMIKSSKNWTMPEGYIDANVSDKIIKYLKGVIK